MKEFDAREIRKLLNTRPMDFIDEELNELDDTPDGRRLKNKISETLDYWEKYREKNKQKLTEYFKKYREKNYEKLLEYQRAYREKKKAGRPKIEKPKPIAKPKRQVMTPEERQAKYNEYQKRRRAEQSEELRERRREYMRNYMKSYRKLQ